MQLLFFSIIQNDDKHDGTFSILYPAQIRPLAFVSRPWSVTVSGLYLE